MTHEDDEAGFTLVEALVGIMIVTIGIFAMAAELTAYIHSQSIQKSRTTAVRLMTSSVESARRLTPTQLLAVPNLAASPTTVGGKTFTTTTVVAYCSLTDPITSCTTPLTAALADVRVHVTTSWQDGSVTRSVTSATTVSDDTNGTYLPTGTGSLSTLVGGAAATGTTVTVNGFTVAPTTTSVTSSGNPTAPVLLTLNTVGLTTSTTAIPVTWTDDTGSHQVSLTGGPSAWTATIPASSITRAITSGSSTVQFAASIPGTQALTTAKLTITPPVTLSSCAISPTTILLATLTRKTAAAETLTCTASGLAATDSMIVQYPSGSGTATGTLTGTNGTTWTLTLPAGTPLASGLALSETFTFTGTRVSDSVSGTRSVTMVLA